MTPLALDLGVVVEGEAWVSDEREVVGLASTPPRELARLPYSSVEALGRSGDRLVVVGARDHGAPSVDVWDVSDPARPVERRSVRIAPLRWRTGTFLSDEDVWVTFRAELPNLPSGPLLEVADTVGGRISTLVAGPAPDARSVTVLARIPLAGGDPVATIDPRAGDPVAVPGGLALVDAEGVRWFDLPPGGGPPALAAEVAWPLPAPRDPAVPGRPTRTIWLVAGTSDGRVCLGGTDTAERTEGGGGVAMQSWSAGASDPYVLCAHRAGSTVTFDPPWVPRPGIHQPGCVEDRSYGPRCPGSHVNAVVPVGPDRWDLQYYELDEARQDSLTVVRVTLGGSPTVDRVLELGHPRSSGNDSIEGDAGTWVREPADAEWNGRVARIGGVEFPVAATPRP